jgi:hypothetical protein
MPPIVRGSGVTTKSMGRRMTRTRRRRTRRRRTRTMLALRLSGYGRETKRPAIGYSQRPENSQWADGWAVCEVYEGWADRWAEGEGKGGI